MKLVFKTFFMNIFAERRCDLRLFPTVSPWTPLDLQKKKLRCAEMFIFKRNAGWTSFGLIMFPTVSDRFRRFPTVSDRCIFFSAGLIGPISFMEGWSSANPCKPWRIMTLKFFRATLVRVHCTKYCILTLISIFPKNHKIPGAREI